MAEYGKQERITLTAAADLRNYQHRIVRHSAAGFCNVASDGGAAAANGAIGVLQNKPNTNEHASIAVMGKAKVVVGGAITAGRFITTQGSGKAAHAASGDLVVGQALDTATTQDEVVTCYLSPVFRLGFAN